MLAIPTVHPAFLLRSADGEKGEARFKQTVIDDFRKALALTARKPNWDESIIWKQVGSRYCNMFPTLQEVWEFVTRNRGQLTAVDIETTGEQPLACQILCIGMACLNGDAICVPILRQGGVPYWSMEDERKVRELLAWFLGDWQTPKCFHNGAFDTVVLQSHGMPVYGWFEDTMQLHHVTDGELPHGLAFLASRYTEIPYYKGEVKGDVRWVDLDDVRLRSYNLRDCLATIRVWPILLQEARRWGLEGLYREEITLCQIMANATIRGMAIDFARKDDPEIDLETGLPKGLGPRLRLERDAARKVLCDIAGDVRFNPASPTHLRALLFDVLKFPIVLRTEKGHPATNKDAMVLLALHADTAPKVAGLKALARWRRCDKQLSTWVEGLPILADGRVHWSWKLLPVSGRFSSSPNGQNLPPRIKAIFKAGAGMVYTSVDLSQAELRAIAYLANDQMLLEMYEKSLNVHTVNSTLLFKMRPPDGHKDLDSVVKGDQGTADWLRANLSRLLPAGSGTLTYDALPFLDPKKWKPIRTLGKNFVFGANYGAIAETLFTVIRAKRDPETDEQMFPDTKLGDIEALKVMWERLHPPIVQFWDDIVNETEMRGYYQSPLSYRIRWFRAGFKRNEILNFPIQELVAGFMNKATIRIAMRLAREIPETVIVSQVHDALTTEGPKEQSQRAAQIMCEELNQPFSLPNHPVCHLPPDAPTFGSHFDQV